MNNLIHFTSLNANILQTLGPLPIYLLIFAIIYFIMIRPQVKQQKEHTAMLGSLKKGDKIITRGGIIGTIKNIGSKRADFVRVIANLWSPTTELILQDSIFVTGQNQKYYTGIRSDTAMDPGTISEFRMVIPLKEGDDVSYRTYEIRWESYK